MMTKRKKKRERKREREGTSGRQARREKNSLNICTLTDSTEKDWQDVLHGVVPRPLSTHGGACEQQPAQHQRQPCHAHHNSTSFHSIEACTVPAQITQTRERERDTRNETHISILLNSA